jgi:hypothetical protein
MMAGFTIKELDAFQGGQTADTCRGSSHRLMAVASLAKTSHDSA